jgi:hypothetical protein
VHELVRSCALGRLGRLDEIRELHLRYFLGLVDSLGIWSNTPVEARWSDPIAADLANIDAALAYALDREDAERAQRFGACQCEIELALAHQLRGEWIGSVDACRRALNLQRTHRLMATWGDLIEVVARLCVEQRRWTVATSRPPPYARPQESSCHPDPSGRGRQLSAPTRDSLSGPIAGHAQARLRRAPSASTPAPRSTRRSCGGK